MVKEIIAYLMANGPALAAIVLAILSVAEMIVRITPTEKDDGAVERVGKVIRKAFDYLGVPKNKAVGGGEHPDLSQKESKAP
jgi:hypothetical protein